MTFDIDRRNHKHCPVCKSTNIEIILSPIPTSKNFWYGCIDCGSKILAKREEDRQFYKHEASAFL
jgi:predicted RNA-binding Zn-ribbon protein involved in translation (DUF1610 family)